MSWWGLSNQTSMDRRAKTRYPIECDLEYRISRGRADFWIGTGQTINISSEGLLFYTREELTQGSGIELTLKWPVTLDDRIPLTLRLKGSIVRSERDRAAAQINSHEFRLGRRRLGGANLELIRKTSA
jgi:PilZ domain-containing protein